MTTQHALSNYTTEMQDGGRQDTANERKEIREQFHDKPTNPETDNNRKPKN